MPFSYYGQVTNDTIFNFNSQSSGWFTPRCRANPFAWLIGKLFLHYISRESKDWWQIHKLP